MADNVTLNPGSGGDVIATEDIGGSEYQKIKLVDGTATSTTTIPLSGDLANGLDVDVTRVSGTVTVDLGANNDVTIDASSIVNTVNAVAGDDDGVALLAVRDDALSALGPADGDYVQLRTNSTGALHVTGGGGGTEYTISDAAPTVVTLAGTIRDDTLSTLTEVEGDASTIRVNARGALWAELDLTNNVSIVGAAAENAAVTGNPVLTGGRYDSSSRTLGDGDVGALAVNANGELIADVSASTGGTHTDDSAFTAGTDDGVPMFGMFDDTTPDSVDEGDAGVIRMSANRNLYSTIRDAAGNERGANVTATNDLMVALSAVDNAVLDAIAASTASIDTNLGGTHIDDAAFTPGGSDGVPSFAMFDDVSPDSVGEGDAGILRMTGDRKLYTVPSVHTQGGTTLYKNIDVDESEDEIKGTAGQVYWIHAMNLSASVKYLKLYNATAATVVVGTTTPDMTFPIPTQGDTNGAGFVLAIPNGIAFSTAITLAATTGIADADSGAPGANEVVVNLGYA